MNRVLRAWAVSIFTFSALLVTATAYGEGHPDRGAEAGYTELLRPQFHFTARKNWINDPNGLVFFQGEYHQFFQYNPLGLEGGALKAWGHAISPDLVHWRELDVALMPDKLGSIWSGSAVVDWQNTSGFQSGSEPCLVAIYTTAGGMLKESAGQPFTQSIAYSNDRGRSWTKYSANPVVGNLAVGNRDPKVIWHEPSKRWVMALYLEVDRFALLASPDLKKWTKLQEIRIPGSGECPDFFPIKVDNKQGATKWVFWSANNTYLIGEFDGKKFVDQSGPLRDVVGTTMRHRHSAILPRPTAIEFKSPGCEADSIPGCHSISKCRFPRPSTCGNLRMGLV